MMLLGRDFCQGKGMHLEHSGYESLVRHSDQIIKTPTLKCVRISWALFSYRLMWCLQVAFIVISRKIRNICKRSGADYSPQQQITSLTLR